MPRTTPSPTSLIGRAKSLPTIASTGAAVASILTFLYSWGVIGNPVVRSSLLNVGAKWIGVRPLVDTARSIRDTLHLGATITDKNGSTLFGARPTWVSENPEIASVEQDGTVIARDAGETTIIAVIGELTARARIVVRQTVASVRIAGDSTIAMAEGDSRVLEARAFDPRGYLVPGREVSWKVDNGATLRVDSTGTAQALDVGRAIVSAHVEGVSTHTLVTVAPAPAALAVIKGNAQRARAGAQLSERVIVRVTNRRGRPVEGTLVRFRTANGEGVVDPAAVVTDADGRARTAWTLGAQPGGQSLLATVERVDSALAVAAEADPVPENTRFVALRDTVKGIVGQLVDGGDVTGLRLTDSTGRPLADVPVSWTALDGGTAAAIVERTDSLGEARVRWTLGKKSGAQRLRARIGSGRGLDAPIIAAVARSASPARLVLERSKLKDESGTARHVAVVAQVKDAFGNVVPGAAVRFTARSGAMASASVVSDSAGRAVSTWTLAAKAGDQTLIGTVRASEKAIVADTLKARVPPAKLAVQSKATSPR